MQGKEACCERAGGWDCGAERRILVSLNLVQRCVLIKNNLRVVMMMAVTMDIDDF